MGMFDTVRVQRRIDGHDLSGLDFQTKGLACLCDNYEVRVDGSLWLQRYDLKRVDEPASRWCTVQRSNLRWEQCQISDTLGLYTTKDGVSYELTRQYWDGALTQWQLKFYPEDFSDTRQTDQSAGEPLP